MSISLFLAGCVPIGDMIGPLFFPGYCENWLFIPNRPFNSHNLRIALIPPRMLSGGANTSEASAATPKMTFAFSRVVLLVEDALMKVG